MTTPTLEQARKYAEEVAGYATARVILTLADEIESLTKERDQLQKDLNAELSGNAKLREIIGAKGGETMFDFAKRFVAERDALAAAAKLALDALGAATTPLATDRQEVLRAITALRQAGVQ